MQCVSTRTVARIRLAHHGKIMYISEARQASRGAIHHGGYRTSTMPAIEAIGVVAGSQGPAMRRDGSRCKHLRKYNPQVHCEPKKQIGASRRE